MFTAITSLFDMVKQFLCLKGTEIVNKPTLEVVKEKKDLKKATNYTEEILAITDKYTYCFDKKDLKQYNKLKKNFLKFN